jgi:biotin-(acetyl-CoA carboxylase) ligase
LLNILKAKELAKAEPNGKMFAILADTQRKGRGTRGRVWMSGQKNMFLTVAIKQSLLPIPLNFLPLRYYFIQK